jgi:hypothetical protein
MVWILGMATEQDIICIFKQIIDIENSPHPDFKKIKIISDCAIELIHNDNLYDKMNPYIFKFLEDYDIREKDPRYGRGQLRNLRKYL